MSRRSAVWLFFSKDGDTVYCSLCKYTAKQVTGNTTNMKSHLQNHHPKEYREAEKSGSIVVAHSKTKQSLGNFSTTNTSVDDSLSSASAVTETIDLSIEDEEHDSPLASSTQTLDLSAHDRESTLKKSSANQKLRVRQREKSKVITYNL